MNRLRRRNVETVTRTLRWRLLLPVGIGLILGVIWVQLGGQVVADSYQPVVDARLQRNVGFQEDPTSEPPEPTSTNTPEPPTDTPVPPTETPTEVPTTDLTETPTEIPTETPTEIPTEEPTDQPTDQPTETATYTPQPTATTTMTNTPKPTRTPTPTKTPTRPPLPTIVRFVVDRYSILQGESVVLEWEVRGATLVEIIPGWEGGVPDAGNITVYPNTTFSYRLHACNYDRCADQSVMIQVAPPLPTSTLGPPATPTYTPTATPRPLRVRQIIDRLAEAWPASCPP